MKASRVVRFPAQVLRIRPFFVVRIVASRAKSRATRVKAPS